MGAVALDLILTFLSFFGCFGVGLLPTILAAAAVVDVLRVRAEWYWIPLVILFPVVGPLAYFILAYGPWGGGVANLSPAAARRQQARTRLRALRIQLSHWRGPAVLAEAGDHLITLGKLGEAEQLLREAVQTGDDPKDTHFNFAQVLQVKGGRYAEALPLLESLLEVEPDAKFGSARLALARCYDETGDGDRAEAVLRQVLAKRGPAEGRVRLARLLFRQGKQGEAQELLAQVKADAATMPKYLRREHGPWLRAARRLKSGDARLPGPRLEGVPPRRNLWWALVIVGVLLAMLAFVAYQVWSTAAPFVGQVQKLEEIGAMDQKGREGLAALERQHPWPHGEDLGTVDVGSEQVSSYLRVRAAMEEPCRRMVEVDAEMTQAEEDFESFSIGDAMLAGLRLPRVHAELVVAFADALEAEGMGPTTFDRLTEMVEWRFLGREDALVFGLPDYFRSDWTDAQAEVEAAQDLDPEFDDEWRRQMERDAEKAVRKLEELGAKAREHSGLSAATVGLLEARRSELEGLRADDLEHLLYVLDESTAWYPADE